MVLDGSTSPTMWHNLHSIYFFFLFIWAALLWLGIIYLAYVVDRGNSVKPFCILLNQIFCICDWFQIRIIQVISSHFSLGLLQLAIALTPINCTQVPAPQTDGPSTKVEPEMKPSTESEAQPEDPPLETPPPDRNQDKSDWRDVFFFFFLIYILSQSLHISSKDIIFFALDVKVRQTRSGYWILQSSSST